MIGFALLVLWLLVPIVVIAFFLSWRRQSLEKLEDIRRRLAWLEDQAEEQRHRPPPGT